MYGTTGKEKARLGVMAVLMMRLVWSGGAFIYTHKYALYIAYIYIYILGT